MKTKSDYLLGHRGIKLHYLYWVPKAPEHVLAIIHGLGEHAGRYAPMAEQATKSGIAVFALDLRGHGLSAGKRGHTPSYQSLLNDIEEFLKTIRAEFPDLPIHLYGHSMGGNLVANYLLTMNTNELKSYILSSPYLKLAFEPPAWKVKLANILGSVLPSLSQPNGLVVNDLSKIREEVTKYVQDPLVHPKITVSLYNGISQAARFALAAEKKLDVPGLVTHGGKDRIVDYTGSEAFARQQPNATWKLYPNAFHEPHNDEEAPEVIETVVKWVKGG